jgi:hypothetical protein
VFTWESRFDPSGATDIDHTRYEELPPLSSPANYCPGRFITQGGGEWPTWYRNGSIPVDTAHLVMIDSAPACAHSERTVGKWLQTHDLFSAGCSTCIQTVAGYNAACSSATGKWDASCVALALQHCGSSTMMTAHGECTTGAALPKYATGCTLKLALANVAVGTTLTSDCVDSTKAWNQDCVRAAASLCTGGQETFGKLGTPITDFCGQKIGIGGF